MVARGSHGEHGKGKERRKWGKGEKAWVEGRGGKDRGGEIEKREEEGEKGGVDEE
jgi:hypothetical protein